MAKLSHKSLRMNKVLEDVGELLLGRSRIESITEDKCISCGGEANQFNNDLSRREFTISGFCQKCQDSVFGGGDE